MLITMYIKISKITGKGMTITIIIMDKLNVSLMTSKITIGFKDSHKKDRNSKNKTKTISKILAKIIKSYNKVYCK